MLRDIGFVCPIRIHQPISRLKNGGRRSGETHQRATPSPPPQTPSFASSSLLALFVQKRKAPKISYLHAPKHATVATNADQSYRPPRIPQSRRAGEQRRRPNPAPNPRSAYAARHPAPPSARHPPALFHALSPHLH